MRKKGNIFPWFAVEEAAAEERLISFEDGALQSKQRPLPDPCHTIRKSNNNIYDRIIATNGKNRTRAPARLQLITHTGMPF